MPALTGALQLLQLLRGTEASNAANAPPQSGTRRSRDADELRRSQTFAHFDATAPPLPAVAARSDRRNANQQYPDNAAFARSHTTPRGRALARPGAIDGGSRPLPGTHGITASQTHALFNGGCAPSSGSGPADNGPDAELHADSHSWRQWGPGQKGSSITEEGLAPLLEGLPTNWQPYEREPHEAFLALQRASLESEHLRRSTDGDGSRRGARYGGPRVSSIDEDNAGTRKRSHDTERVDPDPKRHSGDSDDPAAYLRAAEVARLSLAAAEADFAAAELAGQARAAGRGSGKAPPGGGTGRQRFGFLKGLGLLQ